MSFDEKSLKPVTNKSHFKMPRAYVHPPRMHHKSHEAGGKDEIDLSGLTGYDPHAIHDNEAEEIYPIDEKERPVGEDILIIEDSEDDWKKKQIPLSQTKRFVLYNQTIDVSTSVGDLIYNDGTNWKPAEADDADTMTGLLGIYLDDDDVLLWGLHTTTGLTANATYWGSATAGEITTTKPDDWDDVARVIGQAVATTILFFKPDGNWEVIENITLTAPDSFTHDSVGCYSNTLIRLDDSHIVLAYLEEDRNGDAIIKTFEIDVHYNLIQLDYLVHDTFSGQTSTGGAVMGNSLVKIDNTHFMLAYTGNDDDGWIKVFSIDGSYVISQESTFEHEVAGAKGQSLIQLDATHYMVSYDKGTNTYVETLSYNATTFAVANIDTLTAAGTHTADITSLIKIDSTHFAVAYNARIETFSMNGSYVMTTIDNLIISNFGTPSLVKIDLTHLICAHSESKTYLSTFELTGSYEISLINTLDFDSNGSVSTSLIKVNAIHYMCAYDSNTNVSVFSLDHKYYAIEDVEEELVAGGSSHSLILLDSLHAVLAYNIHSALEGHLTTLEIGL